MKLLTIISLLGMLTFLSSGNEFKSLKTDYAAKARFVENLSKVQLSQVDIKQLNLSAAISQICNGGKEKGSETIVNYAILFPTREVDADPFLDKPIEKAKIDPFVTYSGSDISFTVVLDSLCAQAGYVWSVSDNGKGHKIILVEYKS